MSLISLNRSRLCHHHVSLSLSIFMLSCHVPVASPPRPLSGPPLSGLRQSWLFTKFEAITARVPPSRSTTRLFLASWSHYLQSVFTSSPGKTLSLFSSGVKCTSASRGSVVLRAIPVEFCSPFLVVISSCWWSLPVLLSFLLVLLLMCLQKRWV